MADAQPDVGVLPETGADAREAGADAGVDADAGMDARTDARPDATLDVPVDTAGDAGMDAADDNAGRDVLVRDVPPAPDAAACLGRTVLLLQPDSTNAGVLAPMTAGPTASGSCQATPSAAFDVYQLTLPSRSGVVITTDGTLTGIDTVLSVRRTCDDAATELACNDDHGSLTTSRVRTVLDPGSYYVLLGEYGASAGGGSYLLQSSTFVPAANATCATATALSVGTSLSGQDLRGGGAPSALCPPRDAGPQLFYALGVPAAGATVTATPSAGAAFRPVLRVLPAGCSASAACLANAIAPGAGMAVSVTIPGAGDGGAGSVIVSVASAEESPAAGATFTLSAM
jgi:hypothetical protein